VLWIGRLLARSGKYQIDGGLLPEAMRKISKFLPLTHVVTLLRGLWTGDAWSLHLSEVWVLLGLLVADVLISA